MHNNFVFISATLNELRTNINCQRLIQFILNHLSCGRVALPDNARESRVGGVLSGALAGLGGATLSVGFGRGFVGTGVTMVDGRGWIAIVAYLFGNYNPVGAFGASLLFGAMDMLQIQFQTVGISLPSSLIGLFPYVAVLVVLTLVGYTRVPAAVGEPYETEE